MALLIYTPGKKYWLKPSNLIVGRAPPHPCGLQPPPPLLLLLPCFFGWMGDCVTLCAILLKACAHYFLFFHQMIAIQKLWKMLFISCKNSFHSQDIQIFVFPSSPPFDLVGHCFSGWLKKNLKGYDVINFISWVRKKAWHRNFVHTSSIK